MAGGLENDEFDAFMSALNPEYKNDTNYKVAQKALELLQTETDPIKMQEIINNAKTAIGNLIGDMDEYGDGTTPLSEAVKTRAKFIDNKKYSEQLDAYIDDSIEARTHEPNPELFDPEARLERLNALKTAFLSQYEGDGTDLETEFAAFVEKSDKELENVYAKEDVLTESDTKNYEKIKETLEAAGQYANAEEKDAIFDAAADYVMANIVQGKVDSLLASINSQYVYFPQYIEAKSLLDNLKTSATPEADYAKAKELIKELLAAQGVDKIENFVEIEETKNVNLSVTQMTQGLWGYGTTETHGGDNLVYTHFTIQNGKVVWTNDADNKDINKMYDQLRQRIHTQMKEQLGDSYNAEEIDKYFDQAVVNVSMNLQNPTELHSIEELANNTVVQFNAIATAGLHGQETNKVSNNKIDMTQILVETGKIDNYCSGIIGRGKLWISGKYVCVKNALYGIITPIMNKMQEQLGDNFDKVEITRILQTAVDATVKSSSIESETYDVYQYFFKQVNTLYNDYLSQKGY